MPGRTPFLSLPAALLAATLTAPAADRAPVAPAPRPSVEPDPSQLKALAEAAEKAGKWEQALDLYLRVYVSGRPTPEVRERITHCLRNVSQVRRHRDPEFQQFVLSLSPADALNLYAEVVGKLATLYADRDRATPARLYALGLDELDRALGDSGFRQRHLDADADDKARKFQRALRETWKLRPPTTAREARVAAREVVLDAQKQVGVRNPSAVVFELLCGACAGLDEYTVYVPPAPQPGDPLPPATVVGAGMVNPAAGVGYVRVTSFIEPTARELESAVQLLQAQGLRALVVDLRGNPGGSFPAAVQVAGRFLPAGIVVTTDGQAPEFANRVFSSDSGLSAHDFPVVLLVDARTMSAAEAVAVAWKENNRATLVGVPTFGKGAVQCPVRLHAADGTDGSARSGVLVLTVARMAGPHGSPISGSGVAPHVHEPDPARQLDAALAKALELALGMR